MKPKINIDEIKLLKESYQAPEGYFDSLSERMEGKLNEKLPFITVEDVLPIEESYQIPEGYFEGLVERIEERKGMEENVVVFRQRKIRVWGTLVAAACIAMVVVSVVNFGPEAESIKLSDAGNGRELNISDQEIATLLDDRDDEFELTDEEIIDVITHKAVQSESTAIIDFLQSDGSLDGINSEEDFLEEI